MSENLVVPTMAEMLAQGKQPEVLFWVGCAGSFDDRAKKITKAFVRILNRANVSFAVLGAEESCTGDPAKRAGNEFLFQMQAMTNIELLNAYNVKKIVTGCPHCFNTLRNEYPGLGGTYEVIHHSQLIQELINEGKLRAEGGESFKGKKITFDPKDVADYKFQLLGRHNLENIAAAVAVGKAGEEGAGWHDATWRPVGRADRRAGAWPSPASRQCRRHRKIRHES